jgi:acetolactate synthase-1/2/3 large subunit
MTTLTNNNIASFAVDVVAALGSEHVFTLTGGMAMFLNRAVALHPVLTAIYCQHEQACVAAAEGYAKAANFRKAGFAVVTAGPGVSNTITSLISAYGDSTPLMVLAGQIKTQDIDSYGTRTHGIQEIRSRELIEPCVKRFVRLCSESFRQQLIDVCADMFSGRPGPVFVEIPLDVQGMPFAYDQSDVNACIQEIRTKLRELENESPDGATACAAAVGTLLKAQRPLLYVGNGVRISGQEQSVIRFAEKHGIPMVFSWLSFDILPASHRLYFGCPGGLAPIYANEILGRADVILFLGARLDLGTTAFQRADFGAQADRWIVDVDKAELTKFDGMHKTETVQMNLQLFPMVLARVPAVSSATDPNWLIECNRQRVAYETQEKQRLESDSFNVYAVAKILSSEANNKVFVSASSGYAEETFTRFFVPGRNSRFFNGAALGAMGMGLPSAIGAAFGTTQQVICVEADGGIMLNIQELATLSHYAPSGLVVCVLNNGGYESIRSSQSRHFGQVYGADEASGLYIPDFKELAMAFKLRYTRLDNVKELNDFWTNLTSNDAPILVDIHVEKFEYRGPSVKTIMDESGRPSTTPLGEITW